MKLFQLLLLSFTLQISFFVEARMEVAFFEKRSSTGEKVELSKNGNFFHVAIKLGENWLHTDLYNGVELVPTIPEQYGRHVLSLYTEARSLLKEEILPYLGTSLRF